jgi:tetratricopeptide (TPR) repeat protein
MDKARVEAERAAEAERMAAEEQLERERTAAEEQKPRRTRAAKKSRLPKDLARAQANVRGTYLALDPTVAEYLDLIDAQDASPHELAAFGNFIAQSGMSREALAYYDVALRIAEDDPVLWINAGSLHLQMGNLSNAATAFSRALSINPNNAVAHYNLGATFNEMERYDDAIAAYKTALSLDPALGDPTYNPQAANNNLLLAVKLLLYQEQAGSLAVPLLDVTTGKLPGTNVVGEEGEQEEPDE